MRVATRHLSVVAAVAGHAPQPPLPTLTYEEVIAGVEGPGNRVAWLELGLVLADDGGWRFEIEDGMARWRCEALPSLWATAHMGAAGRTCFDLYRAESGDEASNWERSTAEELLAVVGELAAGRAPLPTMRLGPWIEEAWLAGLVAMGPARFGHW